MNIVRQNQATKEPSLLSREWDPFRAVRELMRWDPFRQMSLPSMDFVPDVDVKETPTDYVFRADLPGIKEKDVEISLVGTRLTVSGKREEEKKEETATYYACERSYGSFTRSFTLPEGCDTKHVVAEMKDGVLTLTLPKKPEVQPKKIAITPEVPLAKAKA